METIQVVLDSELLRATEMARLRRRIGSGKLLFEELARQLHTFRGEHHGFCLVFGVRDIALLIESVQHVPIVGFPGARAVLVLFP